MDILCLSNLLSLWPDLHLAIQLLQILERVDKYTVHLQKDLNLIYNKYSRGLSAERQMTKPNPAH